MAATGALGPQGPLGSDEHEVRTGADWLLMEESLASN